MSLLRRTPLKRQSKKRAKADAEYYRRKKAFLKAHPWCQWWLRETMNDESAVDADGWIGTAGYSSDLFIRVPRATDIHHMKKPRATYLNDESTWMAVSRTGHRWIEDHKNEARKKGYLL